MFNKLFKQALDMAENLNELVSDMEEKQAEPINQNCPNCGAQISGKTCNKTLSCEYCGSSIQNKLYKSTKLSSNNYDINSQLDIDFSDEE